MTDRGAKTILVVEDEDLVREVSVMQLQDAGYEVLEAPTATEALAILSSTAGVGLVFTDVNMPGELDGLQLAGLVRRRWPEVRVIVTSGGGQVGAAHVEPPTRFIAKPFSLQALVETVRDLAGDPA